MTTIQQLTYVEPRHLEWREVESPRIAGDGEALIRPLAVARCDLDLYIANGSYPLKGPFAFGHETAGEVLEVGDGVKSFEQGDRVIVPFQINCGACGPCHRGHTNACSAVPPYSAYGLAPSSGRDWGGGLSDTLHVPFADAMLIPIPPGVSTLAAATLSDNVTDGYRAVAEPLAQRPGASVLVVGGLAQSVGLFAVAFAKALGAERVVYSDRDPKRLALAESLGAEIQDAREQADSASDWAFPIVVDASATADGLRLAAGSTAACGFCTSVSNPIDAAPDLPMRSMYMKGITYCVSRVHARAALPHALACVERGSVDPERVVTRVSTFGEAAEIMSAAEIKMVFLRDPSL